ncbi:MAG: ABC transporter permease, partial [Oscillospiraceae bacterium]|nr:ABC transporter permease [Oscillospiraceae bacterium]
MKKKNYFLTVGLILTAVMILLILVGYFWTPYSPMAMDGTALSQRPSLAHLMGTDKFGRDIFSRVLKGAGATFFVAFGTVVIGTAVGTLVGALTGYFGGWVDEVLMR